MTDGAEYNHLLTAIQDFTVLSGFSHEVQAVDLVIVTKSKAQAWNVIAHMKHNTPPAMWERVKFRGNTVLVDNMLRIVATSKEEQNETRAYKL